MSYCDLKKILEREENKTMDEATLPQMFCYNFLRCPASEGKIAHTPNQNLICIIEKKKKKKVDEEENFTTKTMIIKKELQAPVE